MDCVCNLPLGRMGCSYHDMLSLCEKLYLEEHSVYCWQLLIYELFGVSLPFQCWDQNPRGSLSFVVSATMPKP